MSIETIKKIGKILRDVRIQKGMTQLEVAKKAGMGTNRYAIIEQGNAKNMTMNTFEKIVKALGVKGKDILPY
jgi:transcriptional regulator with XRE-family HTH domain